MIWLFKLVACLLIVLFDNLHPVSLYGARMVFPIVLVPMLFGGLTVSLDFDINFRVTFEDVSGVVWIHSVTLGAP